MVNFWNSQIARVLLLAATTLFSNANALRFSDEFELAVAEQFLWQRYFKTPPEYVRLAYDDINRNLEWNDKDKSVNLDNAIFYAAQQSAGVWAYAAGEAQTLLIGLKELAKSCDMQGFVIMRKNNYASRGGAIYKNSSSIRRIDEMVRNQFRQYAANCAATYLKKFKDELSDAIESPDFIVAKIFINRLRSTMSMPSKARIMSDSKFVAWEISRNFLDGHNASDVYDALWTALRHHNDFDYPIRKEVGQRIGKRFFVKEELRSIYKRQVLEPCKSYVERAAQVFIPVGYIIEWKDGRLVVARDALTPDYTDSDKFQDSLVYYRDCVRLIAKPDDALKLLLEYPRRGRDISI